MGRFRLFVFLHPNNAFTSLTNGYAGNSRRPQITPTNLVDIYVFNGDSLQPILSFPNVQNPTNQAGYITAPVNDTWFGTKGLQWNGKNVSMQFYWVLTPGGQKLDGSEIPQTTFTAVRELCCASCR